MYLERVLGSKTKVNIISVLIQRPGQSFNEGRLAKMAGVSASEVNRQIKDLVSIGLINLTRVGRSNLYTFNTGHFLYDPLSQLFRGLGSVYLEIANKVTDYVLSVGAVEAVILAGSLATESIRQDYVSNPSDIDLVVVVGDGSDVDYWKKSLVEYATNEVYPVYGVNVYPIVLYKSDYIAGLSKDRFIMNLHAHGDALYGKKPRRTGSMGG